MKIKAFSYCFKVCITAVLVSPVIQAMLFQTGLFKLDDVSSDFILWIFLATITGAALAIPGLILLWLTLTGLLSFNLPEFKLKLYLSIIGALLPLIIIIAASYLSHAKSIFDSLYLSYVYVLVAAVSIWFYKLKAEKQVTI